VWDARCLLGVLVMHVASWVPPPQQRSGGATGRGVGACADILFMMCLRMCLDPVHTVCDGMGAGWRGSGSRLALSCTYAPPQQAVSCVHMGIQGRERLGAGTVPAPVWCCVVAGVLISQHTVCCGCLDVSWMASTR
jgi:hypothetical protein